MANANARIIRPAAYGWQRAVFTAGLVAGAMDITAAFTQYGLQGISPVRILHSIASGLLGAAAYSGGASTAVLGAFLHFVIATSAATVYHIASRRIRALLQHPVIFGVLFGIAVYFFMNLVVLPLSAFPRKLTFPPKAAGHRTAGSYILRRPSDCPDQSQVHRTNTEPQTNPRRKHK